MSFQNRWRIEANLTAISPLHIGDGGVTHRPVITEGDRQVDIASVATDARGFAYIPGSTLKGNIRAWLRERLADSATLDRVFGVMDARDPQRRWGGKIEFLDAFSIAAPASNSPWWLSERRTAVAPSVSLDRHTHTAIEKKLFYQEYVPPGVTFGLALHGQNLDRQEAALVLAGLRGFDASDPVALGAGAMDGWGRLSCSTPTLFRLTAAETATWLAAGDSMIGSAYAQVPASEATELLRLASGLLGRRAASTLTLRLRIEFDSHFLVNDPSRCQKKGRPKPAAGQRELPDHTPLLDARGQVLLPASSIRGAFRSHAERILRTIAPEGAALPGRDPSEGLAPVASIADVANLPPAARLFGAPGWCSPVSFTDFTVDTQTQGAAGQSFRQEFVAIDRFTGGGAEKKKFDAASVWRPVLAGELSIDLGALDRAGAGIWGLGLLALTLRDLIEGDIPLGFGSAKGYGSCHVSLVSVEVPSWERIPDRFKCGIEGALPSWQAGQPAPAGWRAAAQQWVSALKEVR